MNTKLLTKAGAAVLLAGSAIAGIAAASDRNAADAKAAAADAGQAGKALAHHRADVAVGAAEQAVALAPRNADYRLLLGQSYTAAGRFASARAAFADVLTLAPANGKAALNLVLMQIGTGDWAGARRTLDAHSAAISGTDRGLALALAGDPAGAVQLLTHVVRSGDATPKARQNLALALALAGQWDAAKTVAAVDLSPADVDARLEQWAAFARPKAASDQVAALLGVTPVEDRGQPAQLALAETTPSVAIAAVAASVAPTPAGDPKPATVPAATDPQPGFAAAKVAFGPRAEVVQPLSAPEARMASAHRGAAEPTKVTLISASKEATKMKVADTPSSGRFFVQLGAFNNAAVAQHAWTQATKRLPQLAAHGPSAVNFSAHGVIFYRLSVGGFARGDADAMCHRYRAVGGACFVRASAGDRVAAWAHGGAHLATASAKVQLAAR